MTQQEQYMAEALDLAREALTTGDIPVGCVVVKDGVVIGQGRNRREEIGDATAHAEVEAIRDACAALGSWRLEGCDLYVTLEPCPMCAGAMMNARIRRPMAACWNRTAPRYCISSCGSPGALPLDPGKGSALASRQPFVKGWTENFFCSRPFNEE